LSHISPFGRALCGGSAEIISPSRENIQNHNGKATAIEPSLNNNEATRSMITCPGQQSQAEVFKED
jgi:hypothetical protein